jgi:16S rRNA (uracil1498-N3)-methyltransferase
VPRVAWCADAGALAHVLGAALEDDVTVGGAEGHHLARVRRLRVGDAVTVADGGGTWRPYEVAGVGRGEVRLRAVGEPALEPTLGPGLRLAPALAKGESEDVVRHATELGVDALVPVVSARSVVRWDGARRAGTLDRLRRVAREAAAQCRRARLLVVEDVQPLASLVGSPGLVLADRRGLPASDVPALGGDWLVLVGPEGGFDPDEDAALGDVPRIAVGPHVLRAGTAALAAAAALAGRRRADPARDHRA